MSHTEHPHALNNITRATTAHRDLSRGSSLSPTPHTAEAPATAGVGPGVAPGSGVLTITRGPNTGARFLLDDDVSAAGRHPDSQIFLDHITVSRRHAQIRWLDDEYWINDAGSLNGTYVNRVQIQSLALTHGDDIQIGTFRFTFTCQSGSAHTP